MKSLFILSFAIVLLFLIVFFNNRERFNTNIPSNIPSNTPSDIPSDISYNIPRHEFESSRIGNIIDSWYFGSLGSDERIKEFLKMQKTCGIHSFCSFLKLGEGISHIPNSIRTILVNESERFWAIYKYSNIKLCMPFIRHDLCERFETYIHTKRPYLLSKNKFALNDLTIHYRLGDFVKFGMLIDIASLLGACKSFNVDFSKIFVLDGGKSHNSSHEEMIFINSKYEELLSGIKNTFPLSTIQEVTGNDADEDLYMMSTSPYLVTAAGSFAICGAILNRYGQIRTPALKNLMFPRHGTIPQSQIAKNWHTFETKSAK